MLVVVALCLVAQGLGLWLRRGERVARGPQTHGAPEAFRDLAVGCLVLGAGGERLEELAPERLEPAIEATALLLHAYARASFDSYLALHAGDLAFAARARASDLTRLRRLCEEAGAPVHDARGGWIETLRAFWTAYYDRAPIARFLPERSRFAPGLLDGAAWAPDAWRASFEAFCRPVAGLTTWHRLMLPHRRTLEELAARGHLAWFDLELAFEAQGATRGRLALRFVWDELGSEWFLDRAATVHGEDVGPDRLRLVLSLNFEPFP